MGVRLSFYTLRSRRTPPYCDRARLAADRFPDVGYHIVSRVGVNASAVSNVRRRVHETETHTLPVVDRLLATIWNANRPLPKV